jgi:hypothetical protein
LFTLLFSWLQQHISLPAPLKRCFFYCFLFKKGIFKYSCVIYSFPQGCGKPCVFCGKPYRNPSVKPYKSLRVLWEYLIEMCSGLVILACALSQDAQYVKTPK